MSNYSSNSSQPAFFADPKAYSLVFKLRATADGLLPAMIGHAERGFILELIKERSPDLFGELHNNSDIKAYALTPLSADGRYFFDRRQQKLKVRQGHTYLFKVSFISRRVYQEVLEVFLKETPWVMTLKHVPFHLDGVEIQNRPILVTSKPEGTVPTESPPPNAWKVWFNTPTQFSVFGSSKVREYFPRPVNIFGSLLRLWQQFLPTPSYFVKEEFFLLVEKQTYCRSYRTETVDVRFDARSKEVGFVGWAMLVCQERSSKYLPFLTALLELGEVMNVGNKRTQGFGVMRYECLEENRRKRSEPRTQPEPPSQNSSSEGGEGQLPPEQT